MSRPSLSCALAGATTALALAATGAASSAQAAWNTLDGADFIEPDLVMTRDGVLVARHEPVIGGTTNVASLAQFADRRTSKQIDGVTYADNYFVEDFTLAELKTLRAIQTRGRSTEFDGQFEVPTLAEVIALAKAKSTELNRPIGIYPEVKHSTYLQGVSLAQGRTATYVEDTLVSTLHAAYGNSAAAPVFIQSFEVGNLLLGALRRRRA